MPKKPTTLVKPPEGGYFLQIHDWLARRHELSPVDKLVYGKIKRWCDVYPVAFPQQETLARELALNRRTVGNSITKMEELDLIRRTKKGKGFSYDILDHPWQSESP